MSGDYKKSYVGGAKMEQIQRTIEVERVVNLVKGFGWELVDSRVDGDTIQISIKKTVLPLSPAA